MLRVTWNHATFKALVEAVTPISDELKMIFNADGVEIRMVDYSHVCFVKVTIHPESFVSYEVTDQVVIATEMDKLKSLLKLCKSEPLRMIWGCDGADESLVRFEFGEVVKEIGLLQADLVKAPKQPEIELPIKVKVSKDTYKIGIEAVKDVGGIAEIGFDGSHVSFNCKSSNDRVSVTFNKGASLLSGEGKKAGTSFSVDYLGRTLKGVGDSVTLEVGESLPLVLASERQGCSMLWMIAPRIDN